MTGAQEEYAPNPNRDLWQLASVLLLEPEQSPEGADSASHRGWWQAVGGGGWNSAASSLQASHSQGSEVQDFSP